MKDTLSVTKDMVNDFSKQKFGKGFLDNKGTITNMTLMQNALEGLLNERFGGGMERLSKTTKGLWSTVTGVTKNSLAKLVGMTDDGTIKAGSALALLKAKYPCWRINFSSGGRTAPLTLWQTSLPTALVRRLTRHRRRFNGHGSTGTAC